MVKCDPRAYAKCQTRHLCGTPEDATFAPGSDCDKFNQQVLNKPMTNADRIRAMSDEELAEYLIQYRDDWSDYCTPNCEFFDTYEEAKEATVKWLQQPAEEG